MKKILILSMAPIFPDVIHGGSQKILLSVAKHLGASGNLVIILCSKRVGQETEYIISENVKVNPILKFKQPFPDPYRAPISDVFISIKEIKKYESFADVIYVHDGSIDCKLIFPNIPIVVSIRDMLYSESILGLIAFRRDDLIVNSIFAFESTVCLLNNLVDGIEERLHLIKNGVDLQLFNPKNKKESRELFGIDSKTVCLAFPHRTVSEKGISFLIRVLQELEKQERNKFTLLISDWIDTENQYRSKMDSSLKNFFISQGITMKVIAVPWQEQSMMPYLYSAADITLCLGNAPELFGGNVALESLACGTQVICSAVGAYRSTLSPNWLNLVPYGCEIDVAVTINEILTDGKIISDVIFEKIKEEYSYSKMLFEYERIIINASIRDDLKTSVSPKSINMKYKLAPWCGVFSFGYYHDFKKEYFPNNKLTSQFINNRNEIVQIFENSKNISNEIRQMIKDDLLVEV